MPTPTSSPAAISDTVPASTCTAGSSARPAIEFIQHLHHRHRFLAGDAVINLLAFPPGIDHFILTQHMVGFDLPEADFRAVVYQSIED